MLRGIGCITWSSTDVPILILKVTLGNKGFKLFNAILPFVIGNLATSHFKFGVKQMLRLNVDMSKAFDTISHDIIISKLSYFVFNKYF